MWTIGAGPIGMGSIGMGAISMGVKKNVCLLGLCQTNMHDILTEVDCRRKIGVGVIGVGMICARAIDMCAISRSVIARG